MTVFEDRQLTILAAPFEVGHSAHAVTAQRARSAYQELVPGPRTDSQLLGEAQVLVLPRQTRHLVLRADAVNLQALSELVEATMQVVAELHEVLDVVHGRKIDLRVPVPKDQLGASQHERKVSPCDNGINSS